MRAAVNAPLMPWKNIWWYWINKAYGHLGQGVSLLHSNCDFLEMRTTGAPPFIIDALISYGMQPCIVPNVDQEGASPTTEYVDGRRRAPC